MNFFSVAFISSAFLWALLGAVTIQTNVDVEEPSVIRSPALGKDDGFGWAPVFHELGSDNIRLVCLLLWLPLRVRVEHRGRV